MTEPSPAGGRRGWRLLLALSALHAAAVLSAPLIPTNDGPAHAWNAALLLHWGDADWAAITSWFRLDARPVPNWTGHLLLALLQTVLSPEAADKVLLAAYTLALPLVAGRTLDALRPGAAVWAIALLPLLHGVSFHMGFHNFGLGLVIWWWMLGAAWRGRGQPSGRTFAGLGLGGLALYFTHGLAWLAAWGAIGLLIAWAWGVERRGGRALLWLALAAAPSAALAFAYSGGDGGLHWVLDGATRARHLLGLETLVAVHPAEPVFATALGVLLLAGLAAGLVATRADPIAAADGVLALGVAVLLGYFVAPDVITGATFIHVRAMQFLLFAAVASLAVRPPGPRVRPALLTGLLLIALGLLVVRAAHWHRAGAEVAERVAALDAIGDDGLILHIQGEPPSPGRTDGRADRTRPRAHLVGWSAAKRPRPALPNYEAGTGHFPLVWAEGRDPRPELDQWLAWHPVALRLADWEARGGRIGWVMVSDSLHDHNDLHGVRAFLEAHFDVAERGERWVLHRRRAP